MGWGYGNGFQDFIDRAVNEYENLEGEKTNLETQIEEKDKLIEELEAKIEELKDELRSLDCRKDRPYES